MLEFADLGFQHHYTLEPDPEFPGDGEWSCPTLGFDPQGGPTSFLESRWGAPAVVRVHPEGAPEWVASFAGSGVVSTRGLFALPSPEHFLVVVDGLAMVVNAADPDVAPITVEPSVTQVVGSAEHGLVLLATFSEVTATDGTAIRWRTERLCWDDLTIDAITTDATICSGDFMPRSSFTLSLATGEQLTGPRFAKQLGS